jgi:hypothetical protein
MLSVLQAAIMLRDSVLILTCSIRHAASFKHRPSTVGRRPMAFLHHCRTCLFSFVALDEPMLTFTLFCCDSLGELSCSAWASFIHGVLSSSVVSSWELSRQDFSRLVRSSSVLGTRDTRRERGWVSSTC